MIPSLRSQPMVKDAGEIVANRGRSERRTSSTRPEDKRPTQSHLSGIEKISLSGEETDPTKLEEVPRVADVGESLGAGACSEQVRDDNA